MELLGDTSVHERTERLLAIMAQHELADADVAMLVGAQAHTVAVWRCKNPARIIPAPTLRLLEAELIIRAAKVAA